MTRSKRGPSLFEKLERAKVPRRDLPRTRSRIASASAEDKKGAVQSRPVASPPNASPRSETLRRTGEPFVSFDGDHLRFSFTSGYAAIVIFVAVGCMMGAYWLGGKYGRKLGIREGYEQGRNSYRMEAADEIAAARQKEPASELVNELIDKPDGEGASGSLRSDIQTPTTDVWVSGLTYVVVQEFSAANKEHVAPAQRFLSDRGIETVAVRLNSGSTQLITKQGYNRRDATQRRLADEFLEKVHTIGKSYYANGGGYRLEGYFKLRRDHW